MAAKSNYDWMKEYLTKISEIGKQVIDRGQVPLEYGIYTALKLISILYYSEVFSNVARNPARKIEGFDGAVYIDLFAGSGLVKLTDTGDYVAGSPLCALRNKYGFDYIVCVEQDRQRKEALEARLSMMTKKENFDVIQGNCNECTDQISNLIKSRYNKPIIFTFVDPQGLEIRWDTLEAVSQISLSTDFKVNVTSSGVLRVMGKIDKGDESVRQSLTDYYKDDVMQLLRDHHKSCFRQGCCRQCWMDVKILKNNLRFLFRLIDVEFFNE